MVWLPWPTPDDDLASILRQTAAFIAEHPWIDTDRDLSDELPNDPEPTVGADR